MKAKTTQEATKPKTIQVIPKPEIFDKVSEVAKHLRTSRAGFCEFALELAVGKIESGEMALINGRLQFMPSGKSDPVKAA